MSFNDSTSNANNGTAVGSPTPIAGAVDGGVTAWRGPGYNNDATVPISSSINIASKLISLEFWFRRNDTSSYSGGDGDFFATEENSGNNGYQFLVNHATSNSFTLYNWGVAGENFGAMPLDTAWHHVALVSDNSVITAYVDGSPTSPTATSTSGVATSNTVLNLLGYGAYKTNGWSVDELRLSNTNRSADWVAHEYTQESQASAWYTVGTWQIITPDYSLSGPSSGYVTAPSSNFTITDLTGDWGSAPKTITISDGGKSGAVTLVTCTGTGSGTTPAALSLTGGTACTFTYTPVVTGSLTLTSTIGTGTDPSPNTYGYTSSAATLAFSGCSSGNLRVASSTCTVTITGATFDGTHTVTLSDGGNLGTFTSGSSGNPLTVTPAASSSSFTFTYNPYLVGQKPIAGATSTANWTAPAPFLYTSSSAAASTFTAKADGNWASAGTWNCTSGGCGHATPDTGDAAIIPGYHVTIPVSTAAYIGSCPANNTTYDLQLSDNGTTNGTLEIAGKLWLCGNTELSAYAHSLGDNPTTWPILQLDTGGELDLDNNQNASVAYRTISANNYGWGKLYSGVLTDTCNFAAGTCPTTIKSVNLGGANPNLFEDTTSDSIVYRIYGTRISDCGSASKGCIGDSYWYGFDFETAKNYMDYGVIDIQNSLFLRTGTLQSASGMSYDILRPNLVNNRFLNDLAGVQSLDGAGTYSGSSCNYSGNYFSGTMGASSELLDGCSFVGNVFATTQGGSTALYSAFSDNVIVEPGGDEGMGAPVSARNIWMKTANGVDSLHMMGAGDYNWRATDNICLAIGAGAEGHCINQLNTSPSHTTIMLNNLSLPATANGANAGQWTTYDTGPGNSDHLLYFDHNGMFGAAVYSWGVSVGHAGPYYPGNQVLQSYRANVHYAASAGVQNFPIGNNSMGYANGPGDSVNTANLGWNAMYNATASTGFAAGINTNCNPSAYLGTPYDICQPSKASPDNTLNDIAADPKVIDSTRNPLTWANRLHGQAATEAGMEAAFQVCPSLLWCIEEARTWTARGFQPTNLALKGKAHDGRIVGFAGTYGSGYAGSCTVTFTPQDAADLGTGAAATCSSVSGVPVIQITNPGANYRIATPATVTIGGTCSGGCVAASLAPIVSPHDIGPVEMALIPGGM